MKKDDEVIIISVSLSKGQVEQLDEYKWTNRISRSEAVRNILSAHFETKSEKPQKKDDSSVLYQ